MRINELITESQQLDEGPLANKIGSAVGKGVGTLAKGVGAVAGGVAGLGAAVKKGFAAGKKTVAGAGDDEGGAADAQAAPGQDAQAAPAGGAAAGSAAQGGATADAGAAPAGGKKPGFVAGLKAGLAGKKGQPAAEPAAGSGAAPAAGGGTAPAAGAEEPAPAAAPTAQDINAQGPKGTAPAKQQTGAAAQAMQKTAQATQDAGAEKAGQTVYAQVKSQINNLDKKGKQRILQLLQKSLTQPDPKAAKAGAAPTAGTTQDGLPFWDPKTGKGAKYDGITGEPTPAWKAEQDKQATARKAKTAPAAKPAPAAQPAAPAAQPAAEPAAAQAAPAAEPAVAKKKGGRKKAAAPSQAEIDADREAKMGPTSDSKINTGNPLAEALAAKVEQHKRQMFEQSLRKGEFKIFTK